MNNYYLTLVLKPDLEEKERKTLLDSIIKKVVADTGKVKEDLWGVRDLAYQIKGQLKGYYAHYQISTDPTLVKGLDKSLKLEEDIIRYLLVRK